MTRDEKLYLINEVLCPSQICEDCKIASICDLYGGIAEDATSDAELDECLRRFSVDPAASLEKYDGMTRVVEKKTDVVNSPKHYGLPGGLEVIDVEIATQAREAVMSHCLCTAIEYLLRHKRKNGEEDVEKARWWLNKWHELKESGLNENA